MKTCEHQMRAGPAMFGSFAVIRCLAEVEDGQVYCPAHRTRVDAVKASRVKHDLDLDVLPWDDNDRRAMRNHGR